MASFNCEKATLGWSIRLYTNNTSPRYPHLLEIGFCTIYACAEFDSFNPSCLGSVSLLQIGIALPKISGEYCTTFTCCISVSIAKNLIGGIKCRGCCSRIFLQNTTVQYKTPYTERILTTAQCGTWITESNVFASNRSILKISTYQLFQGKNCLVYNVSALIV